MIRWTPVKSAFISNQSTKIVYVIAFVSVRLEWTLIRDSDHLDFHCLPHQEKRGEHSFREKLFLLYKLYRTFHLSSPFFRLGLRSLRCPHKDKAITERKSIRSFIYFNTQFGIERVDKGQICSDEGLFLFSSTLRKGEVGELVPNTNVK